MLTSEEDARMLVLATKSELTKDEETELYDLFSRFESEPEPPEAIMASWQRFRAKMATEGRPDLPTMKSEGSSSSN